MRSIDILEVDVATTVGPFKTVILPSFAIHTSLSLISYRVSHYNNNHEESNWLWPASQVLNVWWSAIGTRVVYDGLSISSAYLTLPYSLKLLLVGANTWGLRLLYRLTSRRVNRTADDPRNVTSESSSYEVLSTHVLTEAVVRTIIMMPFTLPFHRGLAGAALPGHAEFAHALAVFLCTSGFGLGVLADAQRDVRMQPRATKGVIIRRYGVWSIVRHPNRLGDALVHASFIALLYSAGLLHPLAALGSDANCAVICARRNDAETHQAQEERWAKEDPLGYEQLQYWRCEKNGLWPGIREVANRWLWTVIGIGAGGVWVERFARMM